MRSLIDMEKTGFDLSVFVTSDVEKQFVTSLTQEGKQIKAPEFAMIVPGWNQLADQEMKDWVLTSLFEVDQFRAPIFFCPWDWRWSKILAALKVFPSAGEAKRNGWDKEVEWGLTDGVVRIKKQRGILTIWKPTEAHFVRGYWQRTQKEIESE